MRTQSISNRETCKKNPKIIVIQGGLPKKTEHTPSKSMTKRATVQLVSSNRVYIELDVDEPIAMESLVIKNWIKYKTVGELTLQYKTNTILKFIEFCKKHAEIQNSSDEKLAHENLKEFHSRFVKENQRILIDLLSAAYDLQIRSLLDVTSESVADMINGQTAEEIHKMFDLKEDFTFKEMERVIRYEAFCYKGIM